MLAGDFGEGERRGRFELGKDIARNDDLAFSDGFFQGVFREKNGVSRAGGYRFFWGDAGGKKEVGVGGAERREEFGAEEDRQGVDRVDQPEFIAERGEFAPGEVEEETAAEDANFFAGEGVRKEERFAEVEVRSPSRFASSVAGAESGRILQKHSFGFPRRAGSEMALKEF